MEGRTALPLLRIDSSVCVRCDCQQPRNHRYEVECLRECAIYLVTVLVAIRISGLCCASVLTLQRRDQRTLL